MACAFRTALTTQSDGLAFVIEPMRESVVKAERQPIRSPPLCEFVLMLVEPDRYEGRHVGRGPVQGWIFSPAPGRASAEGWPNDEPSACRGLGLSVSQDREHGRLKCNPWRLASGEDRFVV